MDINQIRTFLAVVQTGSFVGAADIVHVTQSTVSVRMRTLEDELRVHLFDRGKRGAEVTKAGAKFLRTATAMAQLWDQAKMDIGLPEDQIASLRVGAQVSLWHGYLIPWLSWMADNAPGVALRAQMAEPLLLSRRLVDGALDLAVIYRPQLRPGFIAEPIFTEEVVLVSSQPADHNPFDDSYVLTYWGPEFQEDHALNFPNLNAPRLAMDLGTMGAEYLLQRSGAAYFPTRTIKSYVEAGKLHIVSSAPRFTYSAYAVWANHLEENLVQTALKGLKEMAVSLRLQL